MYSAILLRWINSLCSYPKIGGAVMQKWAKNIARVVFAPLTPPPPPFQKAIYTPGWTMQKFGYAKLS